MQTLSKRFQSSLVYLCCFLLAFQPVMAEIVVDTAVVDTVVVDKNAPAHNQAQVTTTGQGTPMVNIAQPNASGLSHNKFDRYSVDANNLILNNSTQASLILNEVTGTQQSSLAGYTEIGGDRAELIIANPNGISCNGCGFINTPRAVLTTGVPVIDNAQLMSLAVNQGAIRLMGDGVDTTGIDQFDLIGRTVNIDANILARELNIITGRNQVDYRTLSVTHDDAESDNGGQLAIDSSAVGGMYANTIRLVATDEGVGVKLDGTMATDVGDISISADGTIQLKTAVAANELKVASHSADVALEAMAYGNTAHLSASGKVTNNGTLASQSHLDINSGELLNTGDIIAGLDTDNQLVAGADLTVNTRQLTNSGQMAATANQRVTATEVDNRHGRIQAVAGDVLLKGLESLDNNAGVIQAGHDIDLQISDFEAKTDHGLAAENTLHITADNFSNREQFEVESNLSVQVEQHFSNSGQLSAEGALSVHAQDVTNNGTGNIAGGHTTEITALNALDNHGVLTSQSAMTLEATSINNVGAIASGDTLTLTASQAITNSNADEHGLPITQSDNSDGALIANGGENGTLLFSVGDMSLYSDSMTNRYADIYTFGALSIAADADGNANASVLNSSASMESAGSINLATQLFENRRDPITSLNNSSLCPEGSDIDLCTATISGGEDYGIPEGTPLVDAWLADAAYDIVTGDNSASEQYALGRQVLEQILLAASRTPSVIAGEDLNVTAGGVLNQGGLLAAGRKVTINANDFVNQTVVAAALGPGYASQAGYNRGFNVPFLYDATYYDADGNPIELGSSQYRGTLLGRYANQSWLFLNKDSSGNNTDAPSEDATPAPAEPKILPILLNLTTSQYPIAISAEGYIGLIGTYQQAWLQVDEDGNLSQGQRAYDDHISNYSAQQLVDDVADFIAFNTETSQYELTLGDDVYPLITEEKQILVHDLDSAEMHTETIQVLRAEFDPDHLPVEFNIQKVLRDEAVTALGDVSYHPFDIPMVSEKVDTVFFQGQIQAGGAVTINATHQVSNGLVTTDTVTASEPPQVTIPVVDAPTIATGTVQSPGGIDAGDTPVVDGPTIPTPDPDIEVIDVDTDIPNQGGLFNKSDDARYLVATHAAVSQFINSYGSDYLLEQLGYTPEQDVKRLGDGFYESYLVREAIMSQTGQRFLNNGIHSDQQQLQYLMDNAVSAYGRLDLTVGVRLSAEQVAALTHDMLWLEQRTINGQQVLVPVLYLANVKATDIDRNGSIRGRSVSINSGHFASTGSVLSQSFLAIDAAKDVFNRGLIQAKDQLSIKADGNIRNQSELTSANAAVTLFTNKGDVQIDQSQLNAATDIVLSSTEGGLNVTASNLNADNIYITSTTGHIQNIDNQLIATNTVALESEGDLTSKNSLLKGGQSVSMIARGNLSNDKQTQLDTGHDLTLHSGGDLNNQTELTASGDIDLKARNVRNT
ncbi:MAG: filamentous hemagglutinin N-terminal domain-containing protein, partial [Reinekea sp.]